MTPSIETLNWWTRYGKTSISRQLTENNGKKWVPYVLATGRTKAKHTPTADEQFPKIRIHYRNFVALSYCWHINERLLINDVLAYVIRKIQQIHSITEVSIGVAVCTYVWTTHVNSNVNGGRPAGVTTLSACLTACINDPTCTGVDWNTVPSVPRCWLSGSGAINTGAAPGYRHYSIARDCTG